MVEPGPDIKLIWAWPATACCQPEVFRTSRRVYRHASVAALVDFRNFIPALFKNTPEIRAQSRGEDLRTDKDARERSGEAGGCYDEQFRMRETAANGRQPSASTPPRMPPNNQGLPPRRLTAVRQKGPPRHIDKPAAAAGESIRPVREPVKV